MENIAQSYDETKADTMREANNEYFIASFSDDAEDVLHIVRETLPDKRKAFLHDLQEAADFINRAIKDCT